MSATRGANRRGPGGWSEADDRVLAAMTAAGEPISACAARLGRTYGAVAQRRRALGLLSPNRARPGCGRRAGRCLGGCGKGITAGRTCADCRRRTAGAPASPPPRRRRPPAVDRPAWFGERLAELEARAAAGLPLFAAGSFKRDTEL